MTPAEFQAFSRVSRETLDGFATYRTLLLKWQAKINLVSAATLDDVWERHFADSAQLFRMLGEDAAHVADLGSGAGFPGLVLALMARDAGRKSMFHLVESDSRKAAFLIEVALALKLFNHNVRVHALRLEKMAEGKLAGTMGVVVARALAALPDLLAHAAPLLAPRGTCLFLKGTKADDEVAAAQRAGWRFEMTRHASRVSGGGAVLEIGGLSREAPLVAWPLRKL